MTKKADKKLVASVEKVWSTELIMKNKKGKITSDAVHTGINSCSVSGRFKLGLVEETAQTRIGQAFFHNRYVTL